MEARTVVTDPEFILADEPTGNLNAEAAQAVVALPLRLNREPGKSIVIMTHDPRATAFACFAGC